VFGFWAALPAGIGENMHNGTLVEANHHVDLRRPGLRRASLIAALAVILALFILVQEPADAAPAGVAVASVALPGIADGASAQIDIGQIVCPILLELRASYADSPFFSFVLPVIDQLLAAFGCIPGTTTTTVAPTTTTTVAPTTTTTVAPTTTTTVAPTTTTTLFPLPTIPGINIGQITCPILLQLRTSFVDSPFFASFVPIIDQLIVSFDCVISG